MANASGPGNGRDDGIAASVGERLVMIGDQWSWDAVIAPDCGPVTREQAERFFREYGVELPPEGPEEQRFRQVPVTPGAEWDEEFAQDHTGPIHGWMVSW